MFCVMKLKRCIGISCVLVAVILAFSVCVTAVAAESEKITLPVIMYHSILEDKARVGKYVISPEEFEKDLKYIREKGYTTVSVTDLINYTQKKAPLPEKPILLTFDDGYYNNYLYAFPLAQEYNTKIMISPIVYYTDEYSKEEKLSPYYSHITWDQISEMKESGLVEFGNHTYNLHKSDGARLGTKRLGGESIEDYNHVIVTDIHEAQDKLNNSTGVTPNCFVYPFGAISKDTPKIITDMGFLCTLTCEERMNTLVRNPDCLYNLGRYLRTQTRTVEQILAEN